MKPAKRMALAWPNRVTSVFWDWIGLRAAAGWEDLNGSWRLTGGKNLSEVGFSIELPGPKKQVIVDLRCQHR